MFWWDCNELMAEIIENRCLGKVEAAISVFVVYVCGVFVFLLRVRVIFVCVLYVASGHVVAEIKFIWFGLWTFIFG